MIFYLLLCHVLFIPFINSSITTVRQSDITIKTLPDTEPHKVNHSNEMTKVTSVLSEGGSLSPGTSVLALPKLTGLDSEFVKNKSKSDVARKGANLNEDDNVKLQENNVSTFKEHPTVPPKIPEKTEQKKQNFADYTNKSRSSSGQKDKSNTKIPKKPEQTIYEKLTVNSSQGTYSHPGMIMPLVISILLVPMFAVLGYMALRRGQEAWKNRHYKRMDFLLDGMYND